MKLTKTLALAAVLLPSAALAQARPKYEFGIDASLAYVAPSEGDGAFQLRAPVDVRMGWLAPRPMNIEGRFSMLHEGGDNSFTLISPSVHVIYQAGKTAVVRRGMYFTGGLGLDIARVTFEDPFTGDSESSTETDPVIHFGVGTRQSINQAAFRPEGFISYGIDSETFRIGARAGLSFWK